MSKYDEFMSACAFGNGKKALEVLKEGFGVPVVNPDPVYKKNLNRALVWAIEVGDKELVKKLLAAPYNADVHHISGEKQPAKEGGKPTKDRTMLQVCLDRVDLTKQDDPYTDIMFSLLNTMDDVSRVAPRDLKKCFLLAAREGRSDIIDKVLLSGRVSANCQDNASSTALMIAAREGHTEVVKSLLKRQDVLATLNAQNDKGMTALMFAAQNGHGEVVTQLLGSGALTDVQNWDGKTAQELGTETTPQLIADHIATQEAKKREAEEQVRREAEEKTAMQTRIAQLEEENKVEKDKVAELTQRVVQVTAERDEANQKIETLENSMAEVLKRLEALEQERNAQSTRKTETVVETVTSVVEPKDPNAVGTEGEGAEEVDPKTSAPVVETVAPVVEPTGPNAVRIEGEGAEGVDPKTSAPVVETVTPVVEQTGPNAVRTEGEGAGGVEPDIPEPIVSEESVATEPNGPYANVRRQFESKAGKGDHKSIMKRAKKHNGSDIRSKGKHTKGTFRSEKEYQKALATIQQMEEQGLLPKGPNGESNAEFYLWKLRLVLKYGLDEGDLKKSALEQVPGVQAMNGQYLSTEHLTSPGAVFSALCTEEMNGKDLENVAQVLMNTERVTTAHGGKSRQYVNGSETKTSVQCVQDETVASPSLQTRLESATQAGQVAVAEKTGLKSRLGSSRVDDMEQETNLTAGLSGNTRLV